MKSIADTDRPLSGGREGAPCVSVVVPVFNSQATLAELVDRLGSVLAPVTRRYEILLVNDESRDRSWGVIEDIASSDEHVRGIDLMRNYGQHNALLCGIRAAQNEVIVTIDDDLQHPPDEIPRLLEKLADGYDVVYGTPQTEQHGVWRDVASQVTKLALSRAMGSETARAASAFRAFRASLRNGFERYQGPFVSVDVLLTWATTRFAAVPVRHEPRRVGVSNYTFRKLLAHAIDMTTGFTTLPLRISSVVGFLFTIFGVGVLCFVVGRYLIEGTSVPGFPFLASLIAIFSGAQFFALGVIGEYLARMHSRTMDRPAYVIRSNTGPHGNVPKAGRMEG